MKKTTFLTLTAALLFAGCTLFSPKAKVPRTELQVETQSWEVRLNAEKDTTIGTMDAVVQTNGTITLHISSLVATNSPEVIKETGIAGKLILDGQGNIVNEGGKVVGKVVDGVITLF